MVKMGLLENGGFYDRNHNGIIETSRDLDGNGLIEGAELLDWGMDECVLWEIIVIPGLEGTYRPGEYTGRYSGTPGPRGIAVDRYNNVWAGTYGTKIYYYINGTTGEIIHNINIKSSGHTPYGAIVDKNGILWSSGSNSKQVLRLDPKTNTFTIIRVAHCAYGISLDQDNHLFVSGGQHSWLTRINTITGTIDWRKPAVPGSGVAVTDDGDVWIANQAARTVTRYTNNGDFKATIIVGKTPKGVSIDNNGKIWVVNNGDEYIHRIDPLTNQLDLSKAIPGTRHYGYSDMTGAVSQSITTQKGIWTVIHDSGTPNTPWGIINWTGYEPTNTQITVRVKSSNDNTNWSPWETVTKNELLNRTPPGQYLMIETTLQRFQGSISPILYDLTVKALVADLSIQVIGDSEVIAGEQQSYQVTIENQGPYQSPNTIFTGDVPLKDPEYSLDNGTTWNTWTGMLNLGNFNNGDYKTLLITGLTPFWTNSNLKLVGRVLSDTMDINTINNIYDHFTAVNTLCDLSIKITDYPDPVTSGENLTYHLTIQNAGPSTGRNVNLTGTFSLQNPEYSLDGGSTWQSWTGHLNLGTFEPGSLKSLLLRGLVASSATGVLDCTAQVESDTPDIDYSNNICNESTLLKSVSNLSVTLSEIPDAVAGDKIITTITVANSGPSDAQDVTVSLESVLESLEEFVNNNWVPLVDLMNLGTIPAGETRTIRVRGTIPSALQGAVNIIARVNGTNSSDAIVLLTRKSTQFQVNTETPTSIRAGESINFNLDVTNPGPSTAENVILTGMLPLLNPQYSWDGVIWNPWMGQVDLGRIPENQSMNIIFNGEVSPSFNGTFNFTTSILTENMDPQRFIGPPIGLDKIADLKITLTINNTHPHLDEDFRITILVENQGPSDATQTMVEYELPPGLEIIGNYIYDRQGNRWLLGDIPRGGVITLLLKGQARSLELLQPVAVAYGMEFDPDLSNNRDSSSLLAYLIPSNYTTLPVHAATYNSAPGDDGDPKTVPMQNTGVPLNIMNLLIVTVFLGVSTYKNKHLKNKKLFLLTTLFFALMASGAAFADEPPDTADLNPDTVRSGDLITIEANTTTSTTKVKVYIEDESYDMVKETDNIWRYKYITPQVADGNYPVLITAWNTSGGEQQFNLNFTIDNTPPLMGATLNTDHLRAGDTLTFKVDSDTDTATIQALLRGETLNLAKETDGTWNLEYQIPTSTPDGLYTLILVGQDNLGNTATNYIPLTIDNTPLPHRAHQHSWVRSPQMLPSPEKI
ncbi:hypothetical protein GCM10025861_05010 [Methanobacterium petrolearium]|nr:hypothetical protein GCM10025861_05010 [Methanobacterium petrolearium]